MSLPLATERLAFAFHRAVSALLAERHADGYWTGELSASALSTATAVSALALVQRHAGFPDDKLINNGLGWLVEHQNPDGGWGDTVKSVSNISTSMLVRAAFHLTGSAKKYSDSLRRLEPYLEVQCGKTPEEQAESIRRRYGKDRTFAVPILATCALAGLVSWEEVTPLPFELACFPQSWFRFLRLPVVSYALPALIAIGQAVYHHRPPRNPITRRIRRLAISKSLRVLQAIQPSSGGFLEATPLTSFVTLSLASIGHSEHPVTRRGLVFLVNSVQPDGSWAIDSNLSVWVTTLTINALATSGGLPKVKRIDALQSWLLGLQLKSRHPYTGAAPGSWGWTHLPGSVPDADDTSGALLALAHLPNTRRARRSAHAALLWLANLQNRDGGWPTFCRGWANLPFDRSGPDLTAHALRAIVAWSDRKPSWKPYLAKAQSAGLKYLGRTQRPDGSWLPLWFGNQYAPHDENPTYGTARVLAAYRDLDKMNTESACRGVAWLLSAQNADGGWGGVAGVPSSMEETALAVEVLLEAGSEAEAAMNKGLAWLVQQVETGGFHNPSPIGFYFAKLWYYEKLYPMIFTVAALGRALRKLSGRHDLAPRQFLP